MATWEAVATDIASYPQFVEFSGTTATTETNFGGVGGDDSVCYFKILTFIVTQLSVWSPRGDLLSFMGEES